MGLQGAVSDGTDYVVPPGGGVITGWSSSLTGTVDFSVFRGSGNAWTRIAEDRGTIAGSPKTFDVRIPVAAGDRIGMIIPANTPGCAFVTMLPGDQLLVSALPASALNASTVFSDGGPARFNLSAAVEADADGDGFGDETQDRCPGNATVHTACEPAPSLTGKPAKKTSKAKASFVFSGDRPDETFGCAIDGGAFAACTSPFKKKFRPGKHTFQLQATDSVGNRSVPLSYTWKVVKKKK